MLGTMRAIGAQKTLVLGMVLVETLTLSVVFGAAGILLGSAVIAALHSKGIAAPNDIAYFFFSGPRLLPEASAASLVIASALILVVAVVSTIIPAIIATQVSPLRAMQADE
jgi:ABC-type antimicrobial peptide transport system permease subunit